MQTKGVPFALHKGSSFVESWMDEQIVSGQIRFHASSKVNILSRFAYIQYSRAERQRANGSELDDGTVAQIAENYPVLKVTQAVSEFKSNIGRLLGRC